MQMLTLTEEEELFDTTSQQIESDSEEKEPKMMQSMMRPPSISIMIGGASFQSKCSPSSASSIGSEETESDSPVKKGITKVLEWKNKVF